MNINLCFILNWGYIETTLIHSSSHSVLTGQFYKYPAEKAVWLCFCMTHCPKIRCIHAANSVTVTALSHL